ncbi:unnamed protein product [Lactuca saligna]|uniref:RRM domain-containing protein n=1 Tax=Lactuca saligna TaxID=75948 RepID=A0AA35YGC6_LACSI|nr:unnamed protein product [Lactuca saligna]
MENAKEIISFFISNTPNETNKESLITIFQNFGKLVDIYIAHKKDNKAYNFGFVRLWGIDNKEKVEKAMDGIRCGSKKLKVNIAKFKRKQLKDSGANFISVPSKPPTTTFSNIRSGKPFRDVVIGKTPTLVVELKAIPGLESRV